MKNIYAVLSSFIFSVISVMISSSSSFMMTDTKMAYHPYDNTGENQYSISFKDKETPLKVTEEEYDFDVDDIDRSLTAEIKNVSYNYERFEAHYEISNPTEEDITTEIELPFRAFPDIYSGKESIGSSYIIKVNDEAPSSKTLHYFYPEAESFEIPSPEDDFIDETYPLDFRFYRRRVVIDVINSDEEYLYMQVNIPEGVNAKDYVWGDVYVDEDRQYCPFRTAVSYIDLLFLGEDHTDEFLSDAQVYAYPDLSGKVTSHFELDTSYSKDFTLKELMESTGYSESGISESDYYKAVVTKLKANTSCFQDESFFDLRNELLGCYTYPITVKANETIETSISAPLFPKIGTSHDFYITMELSDDIQFESVEKYTVSIETNGYLYNDEFECQDRDFDRIYTKTSASRTENSRITLSLGVHDPDEYHSHWGEGLAIFILYVAAIVFSVEAIILLLIYLISYFAFRKRISLPNMKNVNFLLAEGITSAFILLSFILIASTIKSNVISAILCACVMLLPAILDLIRRITLKRKRIYIPILITLLTITLTVIAYLNTQIAALLSYLIYALIIYIIILYFVGISQAIKETNKEKQNREQS